MKRLLGSMLLIIMMLAGSSLAQGRKGHTPSALMLRFPDISQDKIVFVYANDLWTVSRDGGTAIRLSSPAGMELFPKFSPDGRQIAFTGDYDGNSDVYVMPASGGEPRRLTHHPSRDLVVDWYPDGKNILYRSRMMSPSRRFNKLFKQPVAGGMPQKLPLAYGELAAFNKDASKMVFQLISRQFRTWKRYRGGMASDLWLYDFKRNFSEKLTKFPGTDALPMWHGKTLYFLSDRDANKKLNIWAYNFGSKKFRQVTHFKDFDVKWPSIGPDAMVFENAGKLYVMDLASEKYHNVSVFIPTDLPQVRKQLKNVSKNIQDFSLSATGKRALFEARGDIFTVPAKYGSIRDLTPTSASAERSPAWSPDGKYVAYFSDRTGEYELYIQPANGEGKAKQITKNGHAFRFNPVWSPDSKSIAFSDKSGRLFVVRLADGKPFEVDKDDVNRITQYSWSPDSRWLTYAKFQPNNVQAIIIYDVKNRQHHQITSGYYNDSDPVFDPEGKYLYFFSNRKFSPVYGDMDATWVYPNSTQLLAITLQKDQPSPLAPQSDEEEVKEKEEKSGKKGGKDKKKDDKKAKEDSAESAGKDVAIDFAGIEEREVVLPVKVGNGGLLKAVKGKVLFSRYPAAGAAERGKPSGTVVYYDLKKRKTKTVISGVDDFDISADGKKLIYRSRSRYGIIDIAPGKKVGDGSIKAGNMKAWISPQEEWTQIFNEAWRVERDFFYDPGMHGVNWKAVKKRYSALLPYVVDRGDLNYVIGEMIAELNSSHSYVGGGDMERPKRVNVGLLGCDFSLDKSHKLYRFKKIYEGAPWDAEVRSPLNAPGVDVKEGDYLLAVNGQPLDPNQDPWAAFQGLAGEVVRLKVNSEPSQKGAREVTVKPLSSEFRLRYLSWVESNRKKVEKATNGKIGYVYVPDTGIHGQNELVRQFLPQARKSGLIIDERFNSGGQIPDRFIELLNRPIYNFWARRDFKDWQTPFVANDGPKVMLINGWSGSGGDAFPYYFRKAGLGPLIGKRTWGGLIGYSGNPGPVDGGFLTAPSFGIWNTKGQWAVEGYGVDPDYDVENPPHLLAQGRDPQLEKAIAVELELLKKYPPLRLKKPVYPDKSK